MKKSPHGYGIASCYNALAIGGGAYTLSRIVLKRAADHAKNIDHFFERGIATSSTNLG